MQKPSKTFLDLAAPWCEPEKAAFRILPVPYEGGVSYGRGAALAPEAVIDASAQLELYDEDLDLEPYRAGITTLNPPDLPQAPAEEVMQTLYKEFCDLLQNDSMLIALGGDHSVTPPHVQALFEKHGSLSVIQLDAHADLRAEYEGSQLSHACVMNHVRRLTAHTLQIGIRSLSVEEAQRIKAEKIDVCTMSNYREGSFDISAALKALPDPVFLTIDVDVFDWSVIASTGTPEPGGFVWHEMLSILRDIFQTCNVIGMDVVELSSKPGENNSPFAVAKLIYKMIGLKLRTIPQLLSGHGTA